MKQLDLSYLSIQIICILISISSSSISVAQENFQPLKPLGSLSEDFTTKSIEKYKSDKETIAKSESRAHSKVKDKFYLQSNFQIDELLVSGKILFGDSVTRYVEKVADKALSSVPELRKRIRFYVIKSPVVNAFATQNGMAFVSLGLLARLENEAQLAFVLCHEAVHVEKGHVLTEHILAADLKKNKDFINPADIFLAEQKYSKEFEMEADSEGFEIFSKSGYGLTSVTRVFDLLLYADLPFTEVYLNPDYFNFGSYELPSSYFLKDSLKIVERDEMEDDAEKTHPSIGKRKEKINDKIKTLGSDEVKGESHLVSMQVFEAIRKMALFELCREFLLSGSYIEGLYHTYLLLSVYPESPILKVFRLKFLYQIAKKIVNTTSRFDDENSEGNIKSFFHLFQNISENEVLLLAARDAALMHRTYPNNPEITLMYQDLLYEIASKFENVQVFNIQDPKLSKDWVADSSKASSTELEINRKDSRNEYYLYAFSEDLTNDASTIEELYKQKLRYNDENIPGGIAYNERLKNKTKTERKNKNKGYALGLNKVLVASPFYNKYNTRRKQTERFKVSEETKILIDEQMQIAAKSAGLDADFFSLEQLQQNDIMEFTHNGIFMEWVSEKATNNAFEYYAVSPIHNEIVAIAKEYGTAHLSFIGCRNVTSSRSFRLGVLIVTAVYYPTLPLGIYYAFTPKNSFTYFSLLFNVEKDELEMTEIKRVSVGRNLNYMGHNFNYTFQQYKNKRK